MNKIIITAILTALLSCTANKIIKINTKNEISNECLVKMERIANDSLKTNKYIFHQVIINGIHMLEFTARNKDYNTTLTIGVDDSCNIDTISMKNWLNINTEYNLKQ